MSFLESGVTIFPLQNCWSLDLLKDKLVQKIGPLETLHQRVSKKEVNDLRLELIQFINRENFKDQYYHLGKEYLDEIVGNELAVQKSLNLSVQMPGDESSVLPPHKDTEAGNSPFEVVLWIPLTKAYGTNSLYIREKGQNELKSLTLNYGEGVIFSHQLLHGNQLNCEEETRVSLNLRFKSLWAPYGNKGLGESFVPLTIKPATRLGMEGQL